MRRAIEKAEPDQGLCGIAAQVLSQPVGNCVRRVAALTDGALGYTLVAEVYALRTMPQSSICSKAPRLHKVLEWFQRRCMGPTLVFCDGQTLPVHTRHASE